MGKNPELLDANYIKYQLKDYHAVSVREERTQKILIDNSTFPTVSIALDPTLLLDISEYEVFSDEKPLVKGNYVFFYDPFVRPQIFSIALRIAKENGYRIIVDRPYPKHYYEGFTNLQFYTNVGPKEFLNLVKFSRLVLAHSLHAVIFSIIYKKDFYAIDGDKDSRINYILKIFGLENRYINVDEATIHDNESIKKWDTIYERHRKLRELSMNFLHNAIK